MQVIYELDAIGDYVWNFHTPNAFTNQLPFRVTEVGYFELGANFFTRRSGKTDFLFIQTMAGSGEMVFQNNTYTLKKGSVFIMDCNPAHYYRTLTPPWSIKWFHFNGTSARLYYDSIVAKSNCFELKHSRFFDENMSLLINMSTEQNPLHSIEACNLIDSMLTTLFQISYEEKQEVFTSHLSELNSVIEYIKIHYNEPLKLDHLCSLVHLSKFYFLGLFKEYTGSTPCEYIINYRISQAKKYLRFTQLPLSEICVLTGFTSESYFIKVFKRLNGITPHRYRKGEYP